MKKIMLLVMGAACVLGSYAQFAQSVKDSVLKMMEYPTARYSINLSFKAENYVAPVANDFDMGKLSRQQLLEKKAGNYTDASLYKALFVKSFYEENNQTEGVQFLNDAVTHYEQWINAEPDNTKPLDELLTLCLISKNYERIPYILSYALPMFPKHLPLLHQAIYYHQYYMNDYDKSQQQLDQALALDSFNIVTLQHQVTLVGMRQMQDMQQGKPIVYTPLPVLQKALRVQPNSIGLQHLERYHQLFGIYLSGMGRFMKSDTKDIKAFEYFNLTPQEMAAVNEAEAWMVKAIEAKGSNYAQLLSNLGVIACMKKSYTQSARYFNQSYESTKNTNDLESELMCYFFKEDYNKLEALLHTKIDISKDPLDYGALLKIYNKYSFKKAEQLPLLKKLAALPTTPAKNQVLAAGYLLLQDAQALATVLPLLGDGTLEDISIKLTAAVMADNRTEAATYLAKWVQLNPSDERAATIKSITGL